MGNHHEPAPGGSATLSRLPPVRTVVRLEEGHESVEIAESFVFTSEVKAHLAVISEALEAGRGQGYFFRGFWFG